MLQLVTRIQTSLLAVLWLGACSTDSAPSAKAEDSRGQVTPASKPEPELALDDEALGQLTATEFIDLEAIVNKSPAEVDALLGTPTQTGSDRISCVRFVPKRVFFGCEEEIRVYAHPQFESIRIEFEDGHAAVVALSGLPGEGDFDARAALASVGLELPGEPVHDNPALTGPSPEGEVVDRWEWGNSRARLLIDGLEHRVRLSVVNSEWRRAKLELINNNPLDADQRKRIKQPRGSAPDGASSPGDASSTPAD